jgi:cysteine synthase A
VARPGEQSDPGPSIRSGAGEAISFFFRSGGLPRKCSGVNSAPGACPALRAGVARDDTCMFLFQHPADRHSIRRRNKYNAQSLATLAELPKREPSGAGMRKEMRAPKLFPGTCGIISRGDMHTQTVLELIGHTPLIRLNGENIFAKAEFLNPGGSIKDRVALAMIEGAERSGRLHAGSVLVEPTSGNTGIGIALIGQVKGYRVRIVMPEDMSQERKKLIHALGAELVLTPAREGIRGSVERVRRMAAEDPDIFVPQQFENPDNPRVHYETTARELWRQTGGDLACFVAGVGSGGTLQGAGKFLKEQNPKIHVAAVEPQNVSAILGHEPGLHQIQGIGDGFVPDILDLSLVDEVVEVSDEDAIETTRRLGRENGLLVGISSGANIWAARRLSARIPGNVATVLPDRAERYFSTSLL